MSKSVPKQSFREQALYLPTIGNLRLRSEPATDGIKGQWVQIYTWRTKDIGWAFDGYLRKLTDREAAGYDGI